MSTYYTLPIPQHPPLFLAIIWSYSLKIFPWMGQPHTECIPPLTSEHIFLPSDPVLLLMLLPLPQIPPQLPLRSP